MSRSYDIRRPTRKELLALLKDICDGACWSLSGPRKHIAEIPSHKIEAARVIIKRLEDDLAAGAEEG